MLANFASKKSMWISHLMVEHNILAITDAKESGEMRPCCVCGDLFFVPDWELIIGEPKICSEDCARKFGH